MASRRSYDMSCVAQKNELSATRGRKAIASSYNGATAVRHPKLLPEWYPNSSVRHRRYNRLAS